MGDDETIDGLYRRKGDLFVPGPLTGGPWAADAQGGSATCALLAWAVEQLPTLAPMRTVRYTFDLLRTAPMRPLAVRSQVVREGKRIQVVQVEMLDGDVCVGTCRALRMRRADHAPPVSENPVLPPREQPEPPGEHAWPNEARRAELPGVMHAYDVRVPGGEPLAFPNVLWLKMVADVVEGSPTPPIVVLASAADFTSNLAAHAERTEWSMINADVSVDIVREPVGEWLAVVARTTYGPDGIGHSSAHIHDLTGFVASSMTMGIVEPFGRLSVPQS